MTILQPHSTRHTIQDARAQVVGLLNFLVVGDTAQTHAPLPVGTFRRPSDRVIVYETADVRLVFECQTPQQIRAYIVSRFMHGYERPNNHACDTCGTIHVGAYTYRGRKKEGCLHCTGKTITRAKFK